MMSDDMTPDEAGMLDTIELLRESLADVQRAMSRDQNGWTQLAGVDQNGEFTHEFLVATAANIRVAMAANPLIKRGTNLRAAYIWGDGCQVAVKDRPDQGQDVNAVVQAFLNDAGNAGFVTTDARVEMERDLSAAGEVVLCLPTDPITGRVRVRKVRPSQITAIHTDPEDEAAEQFYLRQWTDADGKGQKAWYPALGYYPTDRPRTVKHGDDDVEVRWDSPAVFVRVNRVGSRGVGDAFAAVPWADAYKGFLEDWLRIAKSLSKFSWQARTRGDKAQQVAEKIAHATGTGNGFASDPNTYLEAISKSGAQINADSGRPAAAMIAAALDIPLTTLLGDPGVTGARAVAADVTESSWQVFDVRRDLWRSIITSICDHVIDSAVIAPAGPLHGTIRRDGDRRYAELPPDDSRAIEVTFPARDDTALGDRIKAVQAADQSELLPPLTMVRLYLEALGVADIDSVLDQVTDDDGNYLPPADVAAELAQRRQDQGQA